MNDDKVVPEQVKGTVNLPSQKPVNVGPDTVSNNASKKTSQEFIEDLKKAAKQNIFTPEEEKNE